MCSGQAVFVEALFFVPSFLLPFVLIHLAVSGLRVSFVERGQVLEIEFRCNFLHLCLSLPHGKLAVAFTLKLPLTFEQ